MGPLFYVIAILGCGEAETACEQVAVAESRYESLDACNAATEGAMAGYDGALYPVVVAQCRQAGAPAAKLLSRDVDLPQPSMAQPLRRASSPAARPAFTRL